MNKVIKYVLIALVVGLVGYKSVYFKKLSERKKGSGQQFDAVAFVNTLWDEQVPALLDSAITVTALIHAIETDPEAAFAQHSRAMAIGNYRYSFVSFAGKVAKVNEDDLLIEVKHADSLLNIQVTTEFVYGNAIRDASGLINMADFPNTADLNNISKALNNHVRSTVLPPFKKAVQPGDSVLVTGAAELNKAHIKLNKWEIIPVRLQILP